VVVAAINPQYQQTVRQSLPALSHRHQHLKTVEAG
jgi:hypothetical protein